MRKRFLTFCLFILFISSSQVFAVCQHQRVKLQVLGSGGPEMSDGRASTAYLIWLDNKAVALFDTGPGSSLNFEKSKARLVDLKVLVYSHFHVDHSADFPAFVKASYFAQRRNDLLVFGPDGNDLIPAATEFVKRMLADRGVFPYLSEYVSDDKGSRFKINVTDILLSKHRKQTVFQSKDFSLQTIPVHHGPIPALAWRIDLAGCSVVFSGDTSNRFNTLAGLAENADILLAHNAIPESQKGVGRNLHMPPSEIGKIAHQANARQLILSHRMNRTLGRESETLHIIKKYYKGKVRFANDMDIFKPVVKK